MGIGLPESLILLVPAALLLWIFAVINMLRSDFSGNGKLIWFLVVTFIPLIGSIAYFFVGTKQKINNKEI